MTHISISCICSKQLHHNHCDLQQ